LGRDIIEFRGIAPLTVDQLIVAVNEVLASRGVNLFSKRTLRYYTTQGIVPSPMGSPKFARYGYEHILCLVGARAMQDMGRKIDQIRPEVQEVHRGRFDRIEKVVTDWSENDAAARNRSLAAHEYREEFDETRTKLVKMATMVGRIPLSPYAMLEIGDCPDVGAEIKKALKELTKIAEQF